MARYIDVDKLIAEYDRVHIGVAGGARKLMVEAPTADVEEVKHGYWKRGQWIDDYNAGGYYLAECNLCGCTQKKASIFCSDCGAKMDGERSAKQ